MSLENSSRIIKGTHELGRIKDPTARIAAQYVFEQLHPGEPITIGHETEEFWYKNGNKTEGHRPDIAVMFDDDREGYLREVTRSRKKFCIQTLYSLPIWLGKSDVEYADSGGIYLVTMLIERDPKRKQKRVMEHAAPDVDYEVWDGDFLEEIQKAHPEYEFFLDNDKGSR